MTSSRTTINGLALVDLTEPRRYNPLHSLNLRLRGGATREVTKQARALTDGYRPTISELTEE